MQTLIAFFSDFIDDERGQSITEYASCIAFVGVLVAVVFAIANGGLFSAVSQSYSSVAGQLTRLNSYTST